MTEKLKKNPQVPTSGQDSGRLHLEAPFRTISTRPGRIVRKGPPVGPAAVYRPVAGTSFSEWDRSMHHMLNLKWIWYDRPSETHLGRLDRWRFCRALGSRVGSYYVGTQLASSLYHEAGTRHVVSGESALLQKAHSRRCCLFCPEVPFTLKQQEMIYYHRFYVESLYPENRRRILR